MEKICPICNALQRVTMNCKECGGRLVDAGPLDNFRGPYSPYMEIDRFHGYSPDKYCMHLLFCPNCGFDTRVTCELITI